jgi:hypothetical protein
VKVVEFSKREERGILMALLEMGTCIYLVRFEVFREVTMRMVSSGMLRRVALVRTDV